VAGFGAVRAQPCRGSRRRRLRRAVDGILAAYLIRNLDAPNETLRRFAGLLRPGARLAVHEHSVGDSRRATATWNAVCAEVIIPAGRLCSGEATLYQYLRRSVNAFDGASATRERLRRNGFTDVRSQTMPGWQRDIVHTFTATAPR
jgi:ubiquinone/menaquinone biosynthesis C-methylase UbiE